MHPRLLILSACLLGLLSTIGAALPYPILPPLFAATAHNSFNHFLGLPPKLLFGLALAINPLGLLIGSALLGPLSDRYGRRPMLLLTTLSCAACHALTAIALLLQSYPLFILARFAAGLTEGNAPVARAMLADQLDGELKVKAFAWFNSALYMGWLIGPMVAALTIGFGLTVPFWLAMGALLLTAAMVALAIQRQAVAAVTQGVWQLVRERHAFTLLAHRELRTLFAIQLCLTLGVTAFYEFYPLWLVEFADMRSQGIAVVTAALCAVMAGSSSVLERFGAGSPLRRAALFASLVGLSLMLISASGAKLGIAAIVMAGLPIALYNAVMPAYCSDRFGHLGQGAVMGLLATIFCIANILVALFGSLLTLLDTRLVLVAGALFALGSAWGLKRWQADSDSAPADTHPIQQSTPT
ncbi:MFS transporter [Chitinimonas sp.]|uniref:MFS transporter n=1 Tax=Chitinimonas sp. TaxID=1934313 RepID=UPI0035AF6100